MHERLFEILLAVVGVASALVSVSALNGIAFWLGLTVAAACLVGAIVLMPRTSSSVGRGGSASVGGNGIAIGGRGGRGRGGDGGKAVVGGDGISIGGSAGHDPIQRSKR